MNFTDWYLSVMVAQLIIVLFLDYKLEQEYVSVVLIVLFLGEAACLAYPFYFFKEVIKCSTTLLYAME